MLILALSAAATGLFAVVPGPAALLIAVAMLVGAARVAPWAGAALADELGGFPPVFAVLAAVAGVSAALAWGPRQPARLRDERPTGKITS